MKDSTKHSVERSNKHADGKKAGVGNEGLATAPKAASRASDEKSSNFLSASSSAVPDRKRGPAPEIAETVDSGGIRRTPTSELKVTLVAGDDDIIYYRFVGENRSTLLSTTAVAAAESRAFAELTKIGVLATSRQDKAFVRSAMDEAEHEPSSLVATTLGYERAMHPRYFVYGDGSVISAVPTISIYPLVSGSDVFDQKGNLRIYEDRVSIAIRNQSIPTTIFFFGLSQVIKPFAAAAGIAFENMMMELVGRSTTYKSSLTSIIAASAWGRGAREGGFAQRWNMSPQKIEEYFHDYNQHLLVLDELTLADPNAQTRGDVILNVVHRLSSGQSRGRTGERGSTHSLSMLSSSNEPIVTIMPPKPDVIEALNARLISFKRPERETGFFDTVPAPYRSIGKAMEHVFAAVAMHHGLLARSLILNILKLAAVDKAKLHNLIRAARSEFLEKAGMTDAKVGTVEHRRIQSFAMSYATAVVAFKTGTLRKKRWGKVKKSILRAWIEHASNGSQPETNPRILAYMTDRRHTFVDCREERKPEISDAMFERVAGLITTGKDKRTYLAIPTEAKDKLGLSAAQLKVLKSTGVLRAGEGLQTKTKLRRVGKHEKKDAFYFFAICSVPPEINVYNSGD